MAVLLAPAGVVIFPRRRGAVGMGCRGVCCACIGRSLCRLHERYRLRSNNFYLLLSISCYTAQDHQGQEMYDLLHGLQMQR